MYKGPLKERRKRHSGWGAAGGKTEVETLKFVPHEKEDKNQKN